MLELLRQMLYANLMLLIEVIGISMFLAFVWFIFMLVNQIKEEVFTLIGKIKPAKKKKKILNESYPSKWEQR